MKRTLQPYLWMLTSSVAFSGMGVLTHLAGRGCPWQLVALVRCLVPLIVVSLWARAAGVRLVVWGPPILWLRSLAGSFSLVGTFFALTHLPPTDVYTLSNMFPVWVALLSWPVLGRAPAAAVWISAFCGVIGVAVIQQPRFAAGDFTALLVVLVSMLSAVAMMGLHHLKDIDPRAVVVHFSGTSLLFAAGAAVLFERTETAEPFAPRHLLLLLGVGSTAMVGQLFLTRAFATGEPARISIVSLTQVVFVFTLDLLLLGHELDASKLLGIPLVVGPAAWLMTRQALAAGVPPPPLEPVPGEH